MVVSWVVLGLSANTWRNLRIRADYDSCDVIVELRNIGDFGRSRRSFGLDAFTEGLIDELGKYILGLDRGFEARLERL